MERFFSVVVRYPKTLVLLSLVIFIATLSLLPKLVKDTRSDAFLEASNPALLYRDKVKEQFGLSDPMVIVLVNEGENGIYTPSSMALINWLTEKVSTLPNVDADHVVSLATEKNILGTTEGMEVTPFFDPIPQSKESLHALRSAIEDFPLYQGTLVSTGGNATVIAIQIQNEQQVESTYQAILALVNQAELSEQEKLYVAGEGAIAGYLGGYIDKDAKRLNPLAGLIITFIIIIAFRRFSPGLLGNVIIAASVLMTLGIMAAHGTPFFVITNAMPVILIGISVADAIHIFSHYFDLQARKPETNASVLVQETMAEMWRPVTLTSLTTAAGFLGLYFASYMPPFKYFGLFTALGVMIAWLYSMIFLPAAIAAMKPKVSRHFIRVQAASSHDLFSRAMQALGHLSLKKAPVTVGVFALLALLGGYSASHLKVDENRIGTFHPSEPIVAADKAINSYLNGSSNLDVVVETPAPEDLFDPVNLRKIEALQAYAETLPHVTGTTSIVDYLKQMNRALTGGAMANYVLPDSRDLVAQYFLIYSASGNPTDFQEEVDYDYRLANISITLNEGRFSETRPVVEALQNYIDNEFNSATIKANMSGRVNLNYHWIKDLGNSHFLGLGLALLLVWLVTSLLFRSTTAGFYALIPVVSSILLVYSAMVHLGINLGIGTSMFASVAIGLGVDFAIHTIDRLRTLYREHNGDLEAALSALYPSTGRALLFNFLAIACGFGVLISSKVVPLNNFGTIVALAVTTSFLASMTLLPALIKVFRPAFITGEHVNRKIPLRWSEPVIIAAFASTIGLLYGYSTPAQANEMPEGAWIVAQINQQPDGEQVTQQIIMTMIDRSGKSREQETTGFRKYIGDEKRTLLVYNAPSTVKNTSFLTYDYRDGKVEDDQWLYLPALRKVRRISASNRGDYFLGTDFTYEDIKKERKIEVGDYQFTTLEEIPGDGYTEYLFEAIPRTREIAEELGYGRVQYRVRSDNWVIFAAEYWDTKDQHLKSLSVDDIRQVDGIWTRHTLKIKNHKTQHETIFHVKAVDYRTELKDSLFSTHTMSRGL
ncbi:MAG: outer membrane lipoprotein-sorting protein [Hahellaceae bacterium]|nr:outer membrane lipoprotein-sorting protein [Hahellaceae bacterium]MCP5170387.1 outer membrane lipoprotein-sorting protein [Hahellaceae bacterium]